MNTITEELILKALGMTRDFTVNEVAELLDVRLEDLRAAIIKHQSGDWKDPVTPKKEEKPPKKQGRRKSG
jgi:hypothetical protein